ncbi:MAG: serine/threonine-protein phosphatase [Cellvibrionaceae bacterium]|nr:serine/threonine-protein phosphatase [Cellvibrionaceae bacterium]
MSTIDCHALSHSGKLRKINEDAILCDSDTGLWAVADGMGGHQAGDYASQCLIEHLQIHCRHYTGPALLNQMIKTLETAHHCIFNYSQQLPKRPIIGTTVVVLLLEADNFHCFWSGDSRCYLLRERQLSALTQDHTEAQLMHTIRGHDHLLSPTEKIRAENTLIHAIGIDQNTPYIDYCKGTIYENDRFLLCSDGINKVYSDDDICSRLHQEPIERINQSLLDDALKHSAPDNLSSIIIGL